MSSVHVTERLDIPRIMRNRDAIPVEELARHRGQWIALSPDGARIIAADEDFAVVERRVIALGQNLNMTPFDHIPDEDSDILGGALL